MYSNCCDAKDCSVSENGPLYSDLGICPRCNDHCTFEDYEYAMAMEIWDNEIRGEDYEPAEHHI